MKWSSALCFYLCVEMHLLQIELFYKGFYNPYRIVCSYLCFEGGEGSLISVCSSNMLHASNYRCNVTLRPSTYSF